MSIYGYARISKSTQSIARQERNILESYPDAHILKEAYTGTRVEGRKEFNKLLRILKPGDTVVFDSVSRMSRNADEGIELYMSLYEKDINLVFLKEPHINTDTYRSALQSGIATVGNEIADIYIRATNEVLMILARQQIKQAFDQAEKEVLDLHKRTSEGLKTAQLASKRVGQPQGAKLTTKKSIESKERIKKYSRDFQGTMTDADVIKFIGISRNSYYKYKKELLEAES